MSADSLVVLCLLLFLDGATFAFFTTPLLLHYGRLQEPWQLAVLGGAASALGSMVQLALLRFGLHSDRPWMKRFLPARERVTEALARFPSASFVAILVARATPLPDAPLKIVAAVAGYPLALYGLAIYLGALPYYFVLALVGRKFEIPTWILVAAGVAIVLGALIDRLRRSRPSPGASR
ncbi:MAG: hypothetical protein HOP12_01465 [Candidatus Eisenbacteria bacterium]|uniref:VTT domain-containing protein n=1 Tax=Eiseniibacteriota bacterium TaxID=2212470 RepID=A0A849SEI2_UNCEI|nr:hypothetical protein [Candidatus Eisenbacteria bacterium]